MDVIISPYTTYHLYNIHYYDVNVKYKTGIIEYV